MMKKLRVDRKDVFRDNHAVKEYEDTLIPHPLCKGGWGGIFRQEFSVQCIELSNTLNWGYYKGITRCGLTVSNSWIYRRLCTGQPKKNDRNFTNVFPVFADGLLKGA